MSASVGVPVPCAVYTRSDARPFFTFSHWCAGTAQKAFPASLRTRDLRAHDTRQNWAALQRACFLVLVSGDVAQCVSLANAHDKQRVRFLYHGSSYARALATGQSRCLSELEDNFIAMHFHGTLGVFDGRHAFKAAVPIECGIAVLPRRVREADVPTIARWVQHCLQRSVTASVWVTHGGVSYNEASRACRLDPWVRQKQFNTKGPRALPQKRARGSQ